MNNIHPPSQLYTVCHGESAHYKDIFECIKKFPRLQLFAAAQGNTISDQVVTPAEIQNVDQKFQKLKGDIICKLKDHPEEKKIIQESKTIMLQKLVPQLKPAPEYGYKDVGHFLSIQIFNEKVKNINKLRENQKHLEKERIYTFASPALYVGPENAPTIDMPLRLGIYK